MEPVKKVSIIDQVVFKLEEFIQSDEIQIGDKLPTEKKLCELLKVGRSTIREAFRILQALGYVEMKPGRGAFVLSKTKNGKRDATDWFAEHGFQIEDFMEVRKVLEPLSVKLAIERASEKEIEKLEKIHESFEESLKGNDPIQKAKFSEAFHNKIAEMSHNQLLITLNKKIADAFFEYRCKAYTLGQHCMVALESHKKVLDAIKKRKIKEGEEAIIEHINESLKDLSSFVEESTVEI